MKFEEWWNHTGSGITPDPEDDFETHARRVAREAWTAAITNSPLPPGETRYRRLADGRIKDCLTGEAYDSERR